MGTSAHQREEHALRKTLSRTLAATSIVKECMQISKKNEGYSVRFDGMVYYIDGRGTLNKRKVLKLVNEYDAYKRRKLQNFRFNSTKASTQFGEFSQNIYVLLISFAKGEEQSPSTLKLVEIFFDTATFDEIERDEKVKFTAALGLVGGTMGLLTGFSIISGIEVVFFLFKLISQFVVNYIKEKLQELKR